MSICRGQVQAVEKYEKWEPIKYTDRLIVVSLIEHRYTQVLPVPRRVKGVELPGFINKRDSIPGLTDKRSKLGCMRQYMRISGVCIEREIEMMVSEFMLSPDQINPTNDTLCLGFKWVNFDRTFGVHDTAVKTG
jgi:hypothetical protein